jgi:hypothetical protein
MIDLDTALNAFNTSGIKIDADFHTLTSTQVEIIVDLAKRAGYRKPKNANGSTGRSYFEALVRAKRRADKQ